MGSPKDSVLPDPVRPRPRTSRPCRAAGIVMAWIGVGSVIPWLARTAASAAGTPRSTNAFGAERAAWCDGPGGGGAARGAGTGSAGPEGSGCGRSRHGEQGRAWLDERWSRRGPLEGPLRSLWRARGRRGAGPARRCGAPGRGCGRCPTCQLGQEPGRIATAFAARALVSGDPASRPRVVPLGWAPCGRLPPHRLARAAALGAVDRRRVSSRCDMGPPVERVGSVPPTACSARRRHPWSCPMGQSANLAA